MNLEYKVETWFLTNTSIQYAAYSLDDKGSEAIRHLLQMCI